MTVWVYVPIVLSAALALLARPIATGSAPAAAARALAGAALLAAVTSTASLILLVATLLDRLPPPLVARNEPGRPRLPEPVPDVVAITAVVLLLIALIRYGVDVRRRDAVHRGLRDAVDHGGRAGGDGVVVADWSAPFAIAVPGRPGHILLTTGMIRLLTADERRVVLAHERAHLARRHHRLTAMASTAAALNPILLPARDAVSYLVERWADEEAATEVGDRHLTARSVAKAALATLDHPTFTPGTPPAGAHVPSTASSEGRASSIPPAGGRISGPQPAEGRTTGTAASEGRATGTPAAEGRTTGTAVTEGRVSGIPVTDGCATGNPAPEGYATVTPAAGGRATGTARGRRGCGAEAPGVQGMHGSRRGHAVGRVRAMTDPAGTTRRTRAGLFALALLSIAFVVTDAAAATDFVVFATAWMP